jgi:hypothetical protein
MPMKLKFLLGLLLVSFIGAQSLLAQQNEKPEENLTRKEARIKKRIERKERREARRVKSKPKSSFLNFHPSDNSLAKHNKPAFYKKRSEPVINIALVYYGDYYSEEDLARVKDLLEKRFHLATDKALSVNTVMSRVIPFKHQLIDYPDYKQEFVTDPERLQRLWYYDNLGAKVIMEVYEQVQTEMEDIDFLLIISGAQFNAIGFANGRVGITENPMEIAWARPNGGSVEYASDAKVVDELIHEMGHTMFLDHVSNQCQKPGLTLKEKQECCKESPARNDVMSFCRDRESVDENKFFGFEECNLKLIKEQVVPAMLNGGMWYLKDRPQCL